MSVSFQRFISNYLLEKNREIQKQQALYVKEQQLKSYVEINRLNQIHNQQSLLIIFCVKQKLE